ncbi:MAG: thiosulfate oxidation carrier protein SoxY [Methylophilaceae bacterium]|nr:thiosulfate oxidation carrier protein SoxY [Methylophilaceae bacterium]
MQRRHFLSACVALLAVAPFRALAAVWNRLAFESNSVDVALQGLGAGPVVPSSDIVLVAPDFAENGAVVQIEVESRIPGTEAIAILAEKNPTPLLANFVFAAGAEPYVLVRVKLAESGEVKAVVKAGGKYYGVAKMVEVAIGGCG